MLRYMRGFANSWFVKGLLVMVAMSFVGFFGWNALHRPYQTVSRDVVASVGGEDIFLAEYHEAYQRTYNLYRRLYGNAFDDQLASQLQIGRRALDNLVGTRVQLIEARRAGLEISDAEVARVISSLPQFQRLGRFDRDFYLQSLRHSRIPPEVFEEGQRQALLIQRLEGLIINGVRLLPAELEEAYLWNNERIKVRYIRLPAEDLDSSVAPDEQAIKDLYEERKEEFREPRKVKIEYYFADLLELEGQVEVTDENVTRYYEFRQSDYQQPERRRARHILFKMAPETGPDRTSEIREKAEAVLAEIQEGGDFVALVKIHSEDPNRDEGGDLGFFRRGEFDPAFEETAFNMEVGEVRGPVQSRFGFHLIQLEEIQSEGAQPLEEVRAAILDILRSTQADEEARNLINQALINVDEGQRFDSFPESPGLKRVTSDFFSAAGEGLLLPDSQAVATAAFQLTKGEVGEAVEGEGGWYLIRLLDEASSRFPPLEEIREDVEKVWRRVEGENRAADRAKEMVAAIQGRKSLDEVASDLGLAVRETPLFRRSDDVPDLRPGNDFYQVAFGLEEGDGAEIVLDGDRLVFVLAERRQADLSKLAEDGAEAENFRSQILENKKRVIYQQWLENARGRADVDISPGFLLQL